MNEIHFCKVCQNMTSLSIIEDTKELQHICYNCNTKEPFTNHNKCIYKVSFNKFDSSELINKNKYLIHDITLPKIIDNPNIQCPNEDCSKKLESSISYIKYEESSMKYIYICNHCGQKWLN